LSNIIFFILHKIFTGRKPHRIGGINAQNVQSNFDETLMFKFKAPQRIAMYIIL